MLLSEDVKKVLENEKCREIFNQFLKEHPTTLKFAAARFLLYQDIVNFQKIKDKDLQHTRAHFIYGRYFCEDSPIDTHIEEINPHIIAGRIEKIDTHITDTVIGYVTGVKNILFQNIDGTDELNLVNNGLFDEILGKWIEHEISDLWKRFEQHDDVRPSSIKTIKKIYPDFKKAEPQKAAPIKPTTSEDGTGARILHRASSSRGSHYTGENGRSESQEQLSPNPVRKNSRAGVTSPRPKRKKEKLSTSSSPTTPKKQTKIQKQEKHRTQEHSVQEIQIQEQEKQKNTRILSSLSFLNRNKSVKNVINKTKKTKFPSAHLDIQAEPSSPAFIEQVLHKFDEPMETWTADTVCRWLACIGMDELVNDFRDGHCTGLDLLALEPGNLLLADKSETTSQSLLFLIREFHKGSGETMVTWNVWGVANWLDANGMEQYSDLFFQQGINGENLVELEEQDVLDMKVDSKDVAFILDRIQLAIRLENSIFTP